MKPIIATFALIALAGPAFAQVKYTDDKGQTHYVGSIGRSTRTSSPAALFCLAGPPARRPEPPLESA